MAEVDSRYYLSKEFPGLKTINVISRYIYVYISAYNVYIYIYIPQLSS